MDSYVRCLNTAGRWAIHGTPLSPLLVWPADQTDHAQAAAEQASQARGRHIIVVGRGSSSWVEGRDIQRYTTASNAALLGCAPVSEGKARRLRTEVEKLEAFCQIVQAAAATNDADGLAAVSRAASKALRAKFGGGSVTSTFAWLAGRAGRAALESVLSGEVELTGPIPVEQIAAAVDLAQQAELLRSDAAGKTS